MRLRTIAVGAILLLVIFSVAADDDCNGIPESAKKENAAQELLAQEGQRQVGMPGITNFTEKRIVRKLYELRDNNIATFTYVMDMQGRLWHVCDSIGYGLPYGVQFTNPERAIYGGGNYSYYTLPQPEPNGLFMPPSAEGTWVICSSTKKKGDFEPIYIEPRVITSPFKLNAAGDWQLQ